MKKPQRLRFFWPKLFQKPHFSFLFKTKRNLEIVDGAEFKKVSNEKFSPQIFFIQTAGSNLSNLVKFSQLLLKYHSQNTQSPKSQSGVSPCGPSLQGFHSKGSRPMPVVSGGEWHAA